MSNNKNQITVKKSRLYFFVLLLFVFLLPIDFSEAQSQNKFQLGLKGGINFSAFTEDHKEFLAGASFGVFGNYYFLESAGISIGLNYERKGGLMRDIIPAPPAFNPTIDTVSLDLYVRNNYLVIPVGLKYRFNLESGISLIPFIGYSYSFPTWKQEDSDQKNKKLISNNQTIRYTGKYSEDTAEINAYSSFTVGLETEYKQFLLDLSYNLALNNIGGASNINNLDYKIHSIKIMIGYRFL